MEEMRKWLNKLLPGAIVWSIALAGAPVLTGGGGQALAEPSTQEYMLTYNDGQYRSSEHIDGGRVVWTSNSMVYLYDSSSKQVNQLTSSGSSYSPDISGNRVVWASDEGSSSSEIFLYDIADGSKTKLTDTASDYESNPIIDGHYVVYAINNAIFLYDIDKAVTKQLNTLDKSSYSAQISFSLQGDHVAWYESLYNLSSSQYETSVYVYTISSDTKEKIPLEQKAQGVPSISVYGNGVVWQQRGSDTEYYDTVRYYDTGTKQSKFLSPGGTDQSSPVIYKDTVVWVEEQTGKKQVFSYDLGTSQKAVLTGSNSDKSSPDLYEDTLVWIVNNQIGSNKDIGMGILGAINQAGDANTLSYLLQDPNIGVTLGAYKEWIWRDQSNVVTDLLAKRPAGGFSSMADVQTAFNQAVDTAAPLAILNMSQNKAAAVSAIADTRLQVDRTEYNALNDADRDAVNHHMWEKIMSGSQGFVSTAEVQAALDAYSKAWGQSPWKFVGEQDHNGWFGDVAADSQGKLYVAFKDDDNGEKAAVKAFDGTSWQTVGNASPADGKVNSPMSLAFDSANNLYLAYGDYTDKNVIVKKFDGSTWQSLGVAGSSDGNPFFLSLVIGAGDVPYVAWSTTSGSTKALAKKYDGTDWVNAGSSDLSPGAASYISLAVDSAGVVYGAYEDQRIEPNTGKAVVKKLDSGEWADVGTPGNTSSAYYMQFALSASGVPYIAYADTKQSMKLTLLQYSSGTWSTVPSSNEIQLPLPQFSLRILGETPYIAYDSQEQIGIVARIESGAWKTLGSSGFTDSGMDPDDHKIIFSGNTAYLGYLARPMNTTTVMKNDNLDFGPLTSTIGAIADQTLTPLTLGYASGKQESRAVYIVRAGSGDLTNLQATLSGTNASDFEITQPAQTVLIQNTPYTSITVKAKDGLARGSHTAIVTITSDQVPTTSFTVTQKVSGLKGDINGDGKVTPADALYITRSAAGSITLTDEEKDILDMNSDGKVDADDVKIIMSIYLGVAQG